MQFVFLPSLFYGCELRSHLHKALYLVFCVLGISLDIWTTFLTYYWDRLQINLDSLRMTETFFCVKNSSFPFICMLTKWISFEKSLLPFTDLPHPWPLPPQLPPQLSVKMMIRKKKVNLHECLFSQKINYLLDPKYILLIIIIISYTQNQNTTTSQQQVQTSGEGGEKSQKVRC